jgi:hypothetical protein
VLVVTARIKTMAASFLAAIVISIAAHGCNGGASGDAPHVVDAAAASTVDGAILIPCEDAGGPLVGDLPCDVGRVLADKCQPCHQQPPKNHAHFSLLTYEDTQQPFGTTGRRRWQRMAEVIEPGVFPHMPFGSAPQLTPEELTILRTWFHTCARPVPEGTGCDQGEGSGAEAGTP